MEQNGSIIKALIEATSVMGMSAPLKSDLQIGQNLALSFHTAAETPTFKPAAWHFSTFRAVSCDAPNSIAKRVDG